MPPPSTRANSPIGRAKRSSASPLISARLMGDSFVRLSVFPDLAEVDGTETTSSTIEA